VTVYYTVCQQYDLVFCVRLFGNWAGSRLIWSGRWTPCSEDVWISLGREVIVRAGLKADWTGRDQVEPIPWPLSICRYCGATSSFRSCCWLLGL